MTVILLKISKYSYQLDFPGGCKCTPLHPPPGAYGFARCTPAARLQPPIVNSGPYSPTIKDRERLDKLLRMRANDSQVMWHQILITTIWHLKLDLKSSIQQSITCKLNHTSSDMSYAHSTDPVMYVNWATDSIYDNNFTELSIAVWYRCSRWYRVLRPPNQKQPSNDPTPREICHSVCVANGNTYYFNNVRRALLST